MRANLRRFIAASACATACSISIAASQADPAKIASVRGATPVASMDSLGPQDGCTSVVANLLRALRHAPPTPANAEKLRALPAYEKQEAACRVRMKAWNKQSPEEKKQEIARRAADVRATLQAMAEKEKSIPAMPPKLGIGDPLDAALLGKELVPPKNAWSGYIDGRLIDVAGSARIDNPAQGVVFVMEDGTFASGRAYDTPTATGPLKVVSATGEMVTLQSTGGKYLARDPADGTAPKVVRPTGGAFYHFNVRTRLFE